MARSNAHRIIFDPALKKQASSAACGDRPWLVSAIFVRPDLGDSLVFANDDAVDIGWRWLQRERTVGLAKVQAIQSHEIRRSK